LVFFKYWCFTVFSVILYCEPTRQEYWGGGGGDAIHEKPQAIYSMSTLTLFQSLKTLLPDLDDDDLHGFPYEAISKSKIVDMMCAMTSFQNINEETLKNGYIIIHITWDSSS
jgi:hypothetical protein